jgi:hypothetical protein
MMGCGQRLTRAFLASCATAIVGLTVVASILLSSIPDEFEPSVDTQTAMSSFGSVWENIPQDTATHEGRKLLMLSTNLLVAGIGEGLMALIILYIVLVLTVSMPRAPCVVSDSCNEFLLCANAICLIFQTKIHCVNIRNMYSFWPVLCRLLFPERISGVRSVLYHRHHHHPDIGGGTKGIHDVSVPALPERHDSD